MRMSVITIVEIFIILAILKRSEWVWLLLQSVHPEVIGMRMSAITIVECSSWGDWDEDEPGCILGEGRRNHNTDLHHQSHQQDSSGRSVRIRAARDGENYIEINHVQFNLEKNKESRCGEDLKSLFIFETKSVTNGTEPICEINWIHTF